MPSIPSQMISWFRILLAIIIAIGGLQGLWVLRHALPNQLNGASTAFIVFYACNVVAAWLLWKKPHVGLSLTLVLQLFQVLRIQGPTLSYALANFAGFWLLQSESGAESVFRPVSCFLFSQTTGFGSSIPIGPTYYGVNLIAIAVSIGVWAMIQLQPKFITATPLSGITECQEPTNPFGVKLCLRDSCF